MGLCRIPITNFPQFAHKIVTIYIEPTEVIQVQILKDSSYTYVKISQNNVNKAGNIINHSVLIFSRYNKDSINVIKKYCKF